MEIVKHELPPEGSWESSLSKLLIGFVGIRLTPGPSENHRYVKWIHVLFM